MGIIKKIFKLKNKDNKIISGDIYYPEMIDGKLPLVIISHGFKGFKDWGFLPYVSSKFAENGNIVICFNFSLNGNPGNDLIVSNVEDFANNTITREVEDLQFLIDSALKPAFAEFTPIKQFWNGSIFLLGHSLGGAISLIVAQNNSVVSKVALWASIAKLDRYTKRQKIEWKKKGFLEFTNLRTNQHLRMNVSYLEDIEKNNKKYDLPGITAKLDKPVLLIHGKQDVTVPAKEAQMMINADNNKVVSYKLIEKTGHTFGIEHPLTKITPALEEAINLTSGFFQL